MGNYLVTGPASGSVKEKSTNSWFLGKRKHPTWPTLPVALPDIEIVLTVYPSLDRTGDRFYVALFCVH